MSPIERRLHAVNPRLLVIAKTTEAKSLSNGTGFFCAVFVRRPLPLTWTYAMAKIRAGSFDDVKALSNDWVIVDIGFSSKSETCALWRPNSSNEQTPLTCTFDKLVEELQIIASEGGKKPLHLLIEAPLSVFFNEKHNPVHRSFEKRSVIGEDGKKTTTTRYWYSGLGCCVMVAATYLMRALHDGKPTRDIVLFEGFVSFKHKGKKSDHKEDVKKLWRAVQTIGAEKSRIKRTPGGEKWISAFAVAGMDFGAPPVIVTDEKPAKSQIYTSK